MSKSDKRQTAGDETESLVASFHRVESLIPAGQKLVAAQPEMRVADALKLMQEHHYSQLPVVAGNVVLGVFSYRSFSARVIAKQKQTKSSLGDLPVEEFLEDFEYVHTAEDWNRVLRHLDQDDAFFVGHRSDLKGMVTTMDVLQYFRHLANPFIMLAEIELSLRQIIQACIEASALPQSIAISLQTAYQGKDIPRTLDEMTFNDYAQIITDRQNWPYFETMFGSQETTHKQTGERLRQLRDWRNVVFHFRRPLEEWELNSLAEHRDWLQRRARAFDARRKTQPKAAKKGQKGHQWDETSFFAKLAERNDPMEEAFARTMLEWASANVTTVRWGKGLQYGSFVPILRHKGQEHQLFTIWSNGLLETHFQWYQHKAPFSDLAKRQELLRRLNEIPGVSLPDDAVVRRPTIPFSVFADEANLQRLIEVWEWVIREIRAS
ncbi:MAG: CBS domain-containing protein [Chloroflexi bacterium]|nr:CBS domain-containing protein [Chloroflexota bacterium]